jgi:hypothetical protein
MQMQPRIVHHLFDGYVFDFESTHFIVMYGQNSL